MNHRGDRADGVSVNFDTYYNRSGPFRQRKFERPLYSAHHARPRRDSMTAARSGSFGTGHGRGHPRAFSSSCRPAEIADLVENIPEAEQRLRVVRLLGRAARVRRDPRGAGAGEARTCSTIMRADRDRRDRPRIPLGRRGGHHRLAAPGQSGAARCSESRGRRSRRSCANCWSTTTRLRGRHHADRARLGPGRTPSVAQGARGGPARRHRKETRQDPSSSTSSTGRDACIGTVTPADLAAAPSRGGARATPPSTPTP